MEITIEEFQTMADDKSQQAIRIAMLEQQVKEQQEEIERLRDEVEYLRTNNTAERLANLWLRNYITLSVAKIKLYLGHLPSINELAFLKTFIEFVLPKEHHQEQLQLVDEVMTLPDKPKQLTGETHNHFGTDSHCQVFNGTVSGQFE